MPELEISPEIVQPRSFFQPWMVLLILPILGLGAMVLVLIGDATIDDASDQNQGITLLDDASPLPQTLPPRTPRPTATSVLTQPIPDISLTDLDGASFMLQDFAGKIVVVNFWATWCEPCREEMPALQSYSESRDDVVVVAVTDPANAQDMDTIRAYVDEYELTFIIGIDEGALLHYAFGVPGLPSTFFVNTDGIIQGRRFGAMSLDDLVGEVALLEDAEL